MALQIWLPLNKDTNNKGLYTTNVTNNGATLVTSGKFGGSYKFNPETPSSTTKYLLLDAKTSDFLTDGQSFTMAAFINIATSSLYSNGCGIIGGNEYNVAGISMHLKSDRRIMICLCFGSAENQWSPTMAQLSVNVWQHVAFTYDSNGRKMSLYVNGELVASSTETRDWVNHATYKIKVGAGQQGGWTYNFPGYLNDVRIYDNCLTPQDVKEVYWGKFYELTPQWKHNDGLRVLADASGVGPLTRQTIGNVTVNGNALYFNGTTGSTIKFNGYASPGGALSIWYKYEGTISGNQVLFLDPVSKMGVGYLGSGAFIVSVVSQARYLTTNATANNWNHILVNYNSAGTATGVWVNGVVPATGAAEYWSTAGTIACVGARAKSATIDVPFNGYINEIKAFSSQLTAEDVQMLYAKGPCKNNWAMDEEWMLVLHHNAPATNLFTRDNAKNCDEENLFSRLRIFDNNDSLRRSNGTYEFMVKEKLEATSAEQTFRWTQTSNPTATTCTGYALVSQTTNPNRNFGISFGPTGNCLYSNKASWWCATGSWTAYQGGIPGYGGVVKTGYMDLYVRIDKEGLPQEYTRLEYLEGTGTQWINTEFLVNATNLPKLKYKLEAVATNNGVGNRWWACGLGGATGLGFHVGLGNGKTSPLPFTYARGISDAVTDINGALGVRYKWELDMANQTYKVWSATTMEPIVDTTFTRQTPTQQQNMALYRWLRYSGSTTTPDGYIFGMKIYDVELYENSTLVRKLIPAKRNSDSVLGMYDAVTRSFYTNAGTGTFIAGPEL